MAALFMCYKIPRNSFFIHLQLSRANPLVVSHSMPQLLQLISSRRWNAVKNERGKTTLQKKVFQSEEKKSLTQNKHFIKRGKINLLTI